MKEKNLKILLIDQLLHLQESMHNACNALNNAQAELEDFVIINTFNHKYTKNQTIMIKSEIKKLKELNNSISWSKSKVDLLKGKIEKIIYKN